MNVDELASAFEAVPGGLFLRVERVRLSNGTDVVRLVPPPFLESAALRLRELSREAAAMFGLDGPHDPEERWWRFVLQYTLDHPPSLLHRVDERVRERGEATVTAAMPDPAKASARAVRKCRHLVRTKLAVAVGTEAKLKPSVRRAGASFEWVCLERPDLMEWAAAQRRKPTRQQWEHVKEHGCEAYPGGDGQAVPRIASWMRYVREYLKATEGVVNTSRSGRTSRSIITPDHL